jgi:hypoxanthine-DNA glycosylase
MPIQHDAGMTEYKTCFPPITGEHARILILGSFPGEMSLARQQYYAHPRNSFWPIMANLLSFDAKADYHVKVTELIRNRIGLWDVLEHCHRSGSLDTAIEPESVLVNDFGQLFNTCSEIRAIYFNGSRAEKEFRKRVLPISHLSGGDLELIRLPSTSPAYASLSLEQKLSAWSEIKKYL